MRNLKNKRFGAHEVKKGKFKGSLHIATESYQNFFAELTCLHMYLESRLLPAEPEEVLMREILLDLQNILEHESEDLIRCYVRDHPTQRNQRFANQMDDGFASFKSKLEWLRKRSLITDDERGIMEEIRILRNAYTHARPNGKRPKLKYFGKSLLTRISLRRVFVDVESVLRKLRGQSGKKCKWRTVPPGYASEMNWPETAIEILEKK